MPTLSSSIVKNGVASMRDVEEALGRQVIYGGDLATNLLELARVSERDLTRLLAESHELEPAPPGELPAADDGVLGLVPGDLAERHGFYPLAEDSGELTVAVSDPLPVEVIQDLAFSLGVRIVQRAAPLVRIRQAIARDYGRPMDRRTLRLVAKLEGRPDPSPSSMPPEMRGGTALGPLPRAPSLEPLVATLLSGAGSDAPPERQAPVPRVIATRALEPQNVSTLISPRPPPPEPIGTPPETPSAKAPSQAPHRGSLAPARPRGRKRHRGPYTAAMAEQDLLEAETRDDMLGAYFDFVSQYFEYSALFVVHGDLAEGRDADGPGADAARIRRIGVPLDLPGALTTVRDRGSWQIAPLADDGIDKSLAKDLQRQTRRAVLVLPVVVRGRAVLMLYGDHGGVDVSLSEIGDVLSFTPLVVAALERLILRRKLAASGADPTPSMSLPPVQRRARHHLPPTEQRADALTRALAGEASAGEPPSTDEASPAAKRRSDGPAPQTVAATPAAFVHEQAPSTSSESPAAKARSAVVASRPVVAVGVRRNTPAQGTPRQIEDEDEQPIPLTRRTPPPPAPPGLDDEEPPEDGWDVEESELERSSVSADSDEHAALVAEYKSVDSDTGTTQRLGEAPLAPASHKVAYGPVQPRKRHSSPGLRLPSVIVDLEDDCIALVKRMNEGDQSAQDQLVQIGEAAIPVLTSRFPGPVRPELARRVGEPGARASQCGPILHTLVRLGDSASPFLVVRTADRDPEVRRWATWLLGEMPSSDTARSVARRVVDDSAEVRRAAIAAGRLMQDDVDARTALRDTLALLAADATQSESTRNAAIEALADIRDGRAVPRLIPLLRDETSAVAKSARWALEILTRQRLGRDVKAWQDWWKDHGKRHRIEWLIEALDDDDVGVRRDAGDELKTLTKEYFGFYEDLAPKERKKVQRRYREWWEEKGKARFF